VTTSDDNDDNYIYVSVTPATITIYKIAIVVTAVVTFAATADTRKKKLAKVFFTLTTVTTGLQPLALYALSLWPIYTSGDDNLAITGEVFFAVTTVTTDW